MLQVLTTHTKGWFQRGRVPIAFAALFLSGALIAIGSSAMYYNYIMQARFGAYERQVDRLNAQLTLTNVDVKNVLVELMAKADANGIRSTEIIEILKQATKTVKKASTAVKAASDTVIKAQAKEKVPEPAKPAVEPPKAILPYREPFIEY